MVSPRPQQLVLDGLYRELIFTRFGVIPDTLTFGYDADDMVRVPSLNTITSMKELASELPPLVASPEGVMTSAVLSKDAWAAVHDLLHRLGIVFTTTSPALVKRLRQGVLRWIIAEVLSAETDDSTDQTEA